MPAIASGTATARSSGCPPWPRSSPAAKFLRKAGRRSTPICAGRGMPCPPIASAGSRRWWPSTASSTHEGSSATTSSPPRKGPRCPRYPRRWCARIPRRGASRSISDHTPPTSSAGPSTKGARSCASCWSSPPSRSSSIVTCGARTTWSCGTTAACFTADVPGTSGAIVASCTVRRWPARAPPRSMGGPFLSATYAPSPCPLPLWGRGKWGQTVMPLPPSKLMAVPVM